MNKFQKLSNNIKMKKYEEIISQIAQISPSARLEIWQVIFPFQTR